MPAYSEEVIIRGDASQLEAALKRASGAVTASAATWSAKLSAVGKSMTDLGRKMQSFGRSARTHVTLPILAIGAVATKMALDFEQAFTRIDAVSNASAKQIASWRGEVEKLAVATARDPRELADALYFLASAGLKAADIMPTLEMAAKAAASGLGETKDIARLLAVTLNNYAESGLTAAEATDTLVAAVKAGSAEPDEFADAMGRILPIAAKAGVEFEEIAASLAALSSAGLAVNEGVTAMRGLLAALIAPGSQAAETLKEIGLSADEVRRAIAEDGLQGALILLDEAADGNIDTLRKIIPNIRALTGQFALTGDRAKATALVFDQVANSTGAMDEAFATTAEGPGFKLAQGLTKLKVAAIALGEQLIPIALEVVGVVSDIAESFGRLSKGTQGTIIKVGLLAAAIGPGVGLLGGLLRLGGGLVKGVAWLGGFRAAATAAAGAAGTASAATGTAGLAGALAGLVSPIGLVVGATALLAGGWLTYRDDANRAADATRALGAALFDGRLSLDQFRAAMDAEIAAIEDADLRMALLARQTQIAAGATEIYNRRIHDLAAAYDLTGETAGIFYDAMARGVDLTIKQREQIAAALH
ncbi:MAG: phage tail tape measure protein, partial [Actinomycetota bacterium]